MAFQKFNFSQELYQALKDNNFVTPTPIQEEVIPHILAHKNIMAKAKTGSGKTASFVLPLLKLWFESNYEGKPKIRVLVLTPTRELTRQVANHFKLFTTHFEKKPKIISIVGGESIGNQLYDIQQGCDILVATTGRLLDIISKKQLNLSKVDFFVLDEADKMLDIGFTAELDAILQELPQQRQNLLFSATYPSKMLEISSKIMQNPLHVEIKDKMQIPDITQRAILVNSENRGPLLRALLTQEKFNATLVFMANKRAADNIAAKFRKYGFLADSFHGDFAQEDREDILDEFKSKKIKILFATDLAARGLDISDISCVVNFDLPRSPETYIHRIGRTARAGKKGVAISLITPENNEHFKLIEKRYKLSIQKEQIEGFELIGELPKKQKGKAPIKGKRKSKKDKLREQAKKNS